MAVEAGMLGKTIKSLRENRGWSIYRLAELAGVDKGQLAKLERGSKANLTLETLNKLALALGVAADQLLSRPESRAAAKVENRSDRLLELKRAFDRVGLKDLGFVGEVWQVPVHGYVRAGALWRTELEQGEALTLPRTLLETLSSSFERIYALRVVGESLSGDEIHDGDHILVLPGSSLEIEGKIYLVRDPGTGESVIRHMRRRNGQMELTASNPQYPPLLLSKIEVLGRVIYVQPHGRAL
jgi:SOS-response transcriptional repressor LexA